MTSTTTPKVEAAMAGAFRDVTLGLISLFQVYEANRHLFEAAAQMLECVFWRHLSASASNAAEAGPESLRKIANDLGRIAVAAPLPHEARAQPRCSCLRPPHCPIRTGKVQ